MAKFSLITSKRFSVIFTLFALLVGAFTYYVLINNNTPFGPDPKLVLPLILLNLVIILTITTLLSWQLFRLFLARKRGSIGSRLQTRMLLMFSLVSVLPTIIVAIFSILFFNQGIQNWFNIRVDNALTAAVAASEGYLKEHQENIRIDALAMARDLERQANSLITNTNNLRKTLRLQAVLRSLPEALIFQNNNIIAKTELAFPLDMQSINATIIERARSGEVVVITPKGEDKVSALIRLPGFDDAFLLLSRYVDENVIQYLERTKGSVNEYQRLKGSINNLQIQFSFIFVAVAFLLLVASLWSGMIFASEFVQPVNQLVRATERVKGGDLTTRLNESNFKDDDEFATLINAFNRMTEQLQQSQTELSNAHRKAAWSDVARRVAHEIKNPLTPIQLALERLRTKFSHQIKDGEEDYTKYLDTITRHTDNIGHMVKEFSDFARMPQPDRTIINFSKLVNEAVFSEDMQQKIIYKKDIQGNIKFLGDYEQLQQMLQNLLQNAAESILEYTDKGEINLKLWEDLFSVHLEITDNGAGFDKNILKHITEPYITTKETGTGLGLAIVQKIIDEHGGKIHFTNRLNSEGVIEGAKILVRLPLGEA